MSVVDADAAAKRRKSEALQKKGRTPLSDEELTIELRIYYERLFPVGLLFHWLSTQSPLDGLKYREMSFTLLGDIYIRYCSYLTKEALKNDLVRKVPIKIDIGAVYNAPPELHGSVAHFAPVHKEMVFDIDMTDYDDIRTCCQGADVCDKCWVLMTGAIEVVHSILTQDFGFEHILWVFSGRRGVHCWICDQRARKLTHEQRSGIVDFLSVYMGKEKKVVLQGAVHPSLQRAYDQLLPHFEELLETQGWFNGREDTDKILEFIDPSVRGEFAFDDDDDPPLQKWDQLKQKVKSFTIKNSKKFTPAAQSVRSCLLRIVFGHVYPRLDVNVSKHLNHLLKSPFCVHPKTGKVCVPMDPLTARSFDPHAVPHVVQLHQELNAAGADGSLSAHQWQSTSLKPAIEYFRKFVTALSNSDRAANPRAYAKLAAQQSKEAPKEAADVDW